MMPNSVQQLPLAPENKYLEIAKYFFRLGLTGFGGPLALVAEMQKELVEKRKWMPLDEFRQGFALIKTLPGPVAFQSALYLSYRRSNRWGALLGGLLLLLPAFFVMIFLAIFYDRFHQSPDMVSWLAGFQVGALALITLALRPLTSGSLHLPRFWGLAGLSFLLLYSGTFPEPLLIVLAGSTSVCFDYLPTSKKLNEMAFSFLLLIWICIKAGAFIFGTGLAIVPFLEKDFVQVTGWITHGQFMDALAFGQLTPGPVSVTVTFIGYRLDGFRGAIVASLAIFFPSGFHQLTWFPRFSGWFSQQKWVPAFVTGAMASIAAGVVIALVHLGKELSLEEFILWGVLLVISFFSKIPNWLVVLVGGVVQWVVFKSGWIP